jgi:hypothetical protein
MFQFAVSSGLLVAVAFCGTMSPSAFAQKWQRDDKGRVTITPVKIDASLRNEWPADWEKGFADRANYAIAQKASGGRYGNTFFENEKQSYAAAMMSLLGGYEEPAVEFLQSRDNPEHWSKHTLGIDYYPCFTIKHQMRKYFFFGSALDREYRDRMKQGGKLWTEKDPLRRPNPVYTGATLGWGPDKFNSWVDVRSTDNLKLMRDTSVYLMAEETGNEAVRKQYKQHLTDFIVTCFHQGQGEWDSENYLGHSVAPLLNLYDFAKDKEVKALAKAGLDWMTACAAVKYYRGGYNGPTRRDYNHPYPLGGSASGLTWIWFGDAVGEPQHLEHDLVHPITSAYRPPQAVVHLARKNFDRPVEITAGKPEWACWQDPDAAAPTYRETQYLGKNFLFGTLARGTQTPDINGFKAVVYSKDRGADTIMAAPTSDPTKIGSPMYQNDILAPHSTVGQNGPLAVYLTRQSDHPYLFLVPNEAEVKQTGGVTFVICEKTTTAIWPVNLSQPRLDKDLTKTAHTEIKKKKDKVEERPRWPDSKILRGDRQRDGVYGFVIEFDEGNSAAFMKKAAAVKLEPDGAADNLAVAVTGAGGRRLRVQWGEHLGAIKIWRDGQFVDFQDPDAMAAFKTLGDKPLISQQWQGDGRLTVTAGGKEFSCQVTREGAVTFGK